MIFWPHRPYPEDDQKLNIQIGDEGTVSVWQQAFFFYEVLEFLRSGV